jgi:hypothetical protein
MVLRNEVFKIRQLHLVRAFLLVGTLCRSQGRTEH